VDPVSAISLVAAGLAAGAVNGVVGAGTLISFPVLLAAGAGPVVANGTNTLAMSFGSASSAWAYRRELRGVRRVLGLAAVAAVLGAAVGAVLVLALPEAVFTAFVPWLILSAALLVAIQPIVIARLRKPNGGEPTSRPRALALAIGGSSIYGGYFGAGQGVVLMAVLGWLYKRDPQRANAAKNLFAGIANITAAIVFIAAGRVWWGAALMLSIGAVAGGTFGARLARRLPASAMRAAVVVIGVIAALAVWLG